MNTENMSTDESNFLGAQDLSVSTIAPRPKPTKKAEMRKSEQEEVLASLKPAVDTFSALLKEEKKKATDIRTYTDKVIDDASSDGISVIVEIRARKKFVEMVDKFEILLKKASGNEQQF